MCTGGLKSFLGSDLAKGDVHLGIFISVHTLDRAQKEMSQWLTEFAYKENPKKISAE